jgi:hypothetical protein
MLMRVCEILHLVFSIWYGVKKNKKIKVLNRLTMYYDTHQVWHATILEIVQIEGFGFGSGDLAY